MAKHKIQRTSTKTITNHIKNSSEVRTYIYYKTKTTNYIDSSVWQQLHQRHLKYS